MSNQGEETIADILMDVERQIADLPPAIHALVQASRRTIVEACKGNQVLMIATMLAALDMFRNAENESSNT